MAVEVQRGAVGTRTLPQARNKTARATSMRGARGCDPSPGRAAQETLFLPREEPLVNQTPLAVGDLLFVQVVILVFVTLGDGQAPLTIHADHAHVAVEDELLTPPSRQTQDAVRALAEPVH